MIPQFKLEVGKPATYRQQLICAGILTPAEPNETRFLINNHVAYSLPGHVIAFLKASVKYLAL
jgi:hypothetical protein